MRRFVFALLIAAVPMAAAARQAKSAPDAAPIPSGAEPPAARVVSISILYSFGSIPKNLQTMDLWFSMPLEDDTQKIQNKFSYSPYPSRFSQDPLTGNNYMYMEGGPRGGVPMQVRLSFDAQRIESRIAPSAVAAAKTETSAPPAPASMSRWLGAVAGAPLDEALTSRANGVVAGKRNTWEKTRAIYDHIIANIHDSEHPELPTEAASGGNVAATLKSQRGTSVDMASAFVALCRAAGIPARTVIGFKLPQRMRQGMITGHHGWAEFWLEGSGWVPVDPAEGKRNAARRDYYFGSLDADRLAITRDRDLTLVPPQKGTPLNFFIGVYWEGNRQAMPEPPMQIEFTELDMVPAPNTIPLAPRTPRPQG